MTRRLGMVAWAVLAACGSGKPNYLVLSAEKLHQESPWLFSIPRLAERRAVKPGGLVKLIFKPRLPQDRMEAERMWVVVTAAENGRYSGRLDNDPVVVKSLKAGDPIEFGPEHICAIDDPSTAFDEKLLAMVSKRVLEGAAKPKVLKREPPSGPRHSGWWIFGAPDDDASTCKAVPIERLLRDYRALDTVLHLPEGSRLQWDEVALEYR